MVRISDARMSGTAYGTVILHTSPEAAAGGPLAVVRNGDMIELDVQARRLHLDISDAEMADPPGRNWTPPADQARLRLCLAAPGPCAGRGYRRGPRFPERLPRRTGRKGFALMAFKVALVGNRQDRPRPARAVDRGIAGLGPCSHGLAAWQRRWRGSLHDLDAMLRSAARHRGGLALHAAGSALRLCGRRLAGRHVMLEKPPGATLSECHALEASGAPDAGVSIYATWHSREAARLLRYAKAWLTRQDAARLTVTWKEDVRRWHPGQDWIWKAGGLGRVRSGHQCAFHRHRNPARPGPPDRVQLDFRRTAKPRLRPPDLRPSARRRCPAVFDFRQEGDQIWTIESRPTMARLVLSDGGNSLSIDGEVQAETTLTGNPLAGRISAPLREDGRLVRKGGIDMDLSPMTHVADAFLLGRRITVEPFIE
jgi:D-galactose 1-dehydrogenase